MEVTQETSVESARVHRPSRGRRHHVFSAAELAALAARFWSKVDKAGGPVHRELGQCWPWTGALAVNGYGQWHPSAGIHIPAHRFASMLEAGRTLEFREVVMHRCHNRPCCRPAHHAIGSHRLNNMHTAAEGHGFCGEQNGLARLTGEVISALRDRARADSGMRDWLKSEAERLGVRPSHLRSCITGRYWSHLPGAFTIRRAVPSRHDEVVREVSEFLSSVSP